MIASKIFFYLYRTKIYYIITSLLILIVTVQIIDFIELTRSNINKENFVFENILKMSLLKTPFLINEILPFVIIISTAFYFKNLIDNNEFVSIRNVGLSILNIFYPAGAAVLTIGVFSLFILNPISSLSMSLYEKYDLNKNNSNNIVNLNDGNIWLKNKINNNILYINAEKINIKQMSLKDAMIIDYRDKNPKIYFAKEGLIKKRYIALLDVNEINIDSSNMLNYDSKNIEINFIQEDILNSLKYYKYTPFYNYLNYTKSMEKLNYLSNDIILYFLSEILKPLLLISIAFVVTGYVSKFQRNESFFKTIFIAIIIGFILFLIDKLIYSINANNLLSYLIIVSTIPILSVILGTIFIIRVEKN